MKKKVGKTAETTEGKDRISCRLSQAQRSYIEVYKQRHNVDTDREVFNDALEALKNKDGNRRQHEIHEYEGIIFSVMQKIGALSVSKRKDSEEYLQTLKGILKEIHNITGPLEDAAWR